MAQAGVLAEKSGSVCATGQLPGNSLGFRELVKIRTSNMDEAFLELTE